MEINKAMCLGLLSALVIGILPGCSASKKAELPAPAKESTEESSSARTEEKTEVNQIDMSSFCTTDLEGSPVTQEIFKEYDVTMVNAWTTWCPYCIKEMPELENVYQSLPDNANLITICDDADEERELAKQLMQKAGTTFQVLVGNEELNKSVRSFLSGYPTTFLIDRNGHLIGEPMVGAPGSNVAETYLNYVESVLK